MSTKTRLAMIGVGGMARHHIRQILLQGDTTEIAAICEPSAEQYAIASTMFEAEGLTPPPNEPDLDALLAYLRTVPASNAARVASELSFPANLPGSMLAWRLLYFRPVSVQLPVDATLARGAYLVNGIGHAKAMGQGMLSIAPGHG